MDNLELLLTSSQNAQQYTSCLWDYNTKNVQKLFRNGGTAAPRTLEVVGKDYILTSEFNKPLIHVWPLNSQEPSKNTRLIMPEPAGCISICPHNAYLAVGIGSKLYIWQISSGKLLCVQQRNFQSITCIRFSSDSSYVIIGGEDGILVVYNLADLITINNNLLSQSNIGQVEPVYTKSDHSLTITDISVGVFTRKSRLATVSLDLTCKVYDLSSGERLLDLVFTDRLSTVILDAPCSKIYIGTYSGNIKQYNLHNPPRTVTHHVTDKCTKEFAGGHSKKILALSINSLNTVLASGADNVVCTWDMTNRKILQRFEHKSCITNLRFVTAFKNFFDHNFKPSFQFKSLQRDFDIGNDDFTIAISQNYDIELSEDENDLRHEKSHEQLSKENGKLRIANSQLYKAALAISEKYNKNVI